MSGMADRTRAVQRPRGTSVLLVALLLAVSASGCGPLDDSMDSLTLRLEEWDRHRHDTAGKSGQGTALPHPASVREWEPEPTQRSARIRGALVAGLAVSRADIPHTGGTGLHRSPPGQEAPPPRLARRLESPQVKTGLTPGVGSALARTRVAAPERMARLPASGSRPVKALRLAVSVSAPRLQGVVRGRWVHSTEPADVERPLMGTPSPPRLLAHRGTVRTPAGTAGVEGPWRRSPEAVGRLPGPEEPPPPAVAWGTVGGLVLAHGPERPPPRAHRPSTGHPHASARRGPVARLTARVPPGRDKARADVRPAWDAGPPPRGRVQGGPERRARDDHPAHRVRPPVGVRGASGHGVEQLVRLSDQSVRLAAGRCRVPGPRMSRGLVLGGVELAAHLPVIGVRLRVEVEIEHPLPRQVFQPGERLDLSREPQLGWAALG